MKRSDIEIREWGSVKRSISLLVKLQSSRQSKSRNWTIKATNTQVCQKTTTNRALMKTNMLSLLAKIYSIKILRVLINSAGGQRSQQLSTK